LKIADFIATHIKSMDELHVLLLFHGNPQTVWNAEEMGRRLGIPMSAALVALTALAGRGLLVSAAAGNYRWKVPDAELAGMIEELVLLDRQRPVTLIRLIYHGAGSVQAFAEAFKIKKEKGG